MKYLLEFCAKLIWRGIVHDNSKFAPEEAESYARLLPRLKGTTYGSPEYQALLDELKPALEHHYQNRHHPEAHVFGIDGMSFLDLVEMWYDWKAATKKHDDGNLENSIKVNTTRFKLSEQLANIMRNSIK